MEHQANGKSLTITSKITQRQEKHNTLPVDELNSSNKKLLSNTSLLTHQSKLSTSESERKLTMQINDVDKQSDSNDEHDITNISSITNKKSQQHDTETVSSSSSKPSSKLDQSSAQNTQPQQQQTQQFLPLTRSRHRENVVSQEVLDMNYIEGPVSPSNAASRSRLNQSALKEHEYLAIYDVIEYDATSFGAALFIRNFILSEWLSNPKKLLSHKEVFEPCLSQLDANFEQKPPQYKLENIFNRIFHFLNRHGYINFGIIDNQFSTQDSDVIINDKARKAATMPINLYSPPLKNSKRPGRVIIIGAGLSGLVAARQLQRFGMEVIIFEARNRVGGRVQTYRKGMIYQDIGPSSLNGVTGNPIVVLGRQLDVHAIELKSGISLFESKVDKNGLAVAHNVDSLLEKAVEREYNKIMEGTRVMKHNYRIHKYKGIPFPLGMSVDWVMKLQEKNVKDEQKQHLRSVESLYKQLIESVNTKLLKAKTIKELHGRLINLKAATQDNLNHSDQSLVNIFNLRAVTRDLDIAMREYKLLSEQEEELHTKIEELSKNYPSDTYLSLNDRRLLDWHFAELEYALGCPINKLDIFYEDDEAMFEGSHWWLVDGFGQLTDALKNDLNIQLSTAIKKIIVKKNGCKVVTYNPESNNLNLVEHTADAILCTLPLGILHESIKYSQQDTANETSKQESSKMQHKGPQPVIFKPQLPKWKTSALNRLGYGNLNKIILVFDKIFWNPESHLVGTINHRALHRGELFLFWHFTRSPVLTGLFSGESADLIEDLSDQEIVERALALLRSIYGLSNVPTPKDFVITRWRKDPWSRGAWSYLQTGAKSSDYEDAGAPVILEPDEKSFKENKHIESESDEIKIGRTLIDATDELPRLFFAGEHTDPQHFASAHGAIISGLREAARIANIYLGCPYSPNPGICLS